MSYSLKDCLELNKNIGLNISEIRISGGGGKSKLWKQILADVFNTELVTLNSTEGAPYGAALLASVGTGQFSSVTEACEKCISREEVTSPVKENVQIYNEYYEIYKYLYPSLKQSFYNISRIVEKNYV